VHGAPGLESPDRFETADQPRSKSIAQQRTDEYSSEEKAKMAGKRKESPMKRAG
jgi:hypothetical protein